MRLALLYKKNSNSAKFLLSNTSILKYTDKKIDLLLNYGLISTQINKLISKYPSIKNTPILNKHIGYSKYKAITIAKAHDILVPPSKLFLSNKDFPSKWLLKKFKSCGGKGIKIADKVTQSKTHYYQLNINKKYELRVHAFSWIKSEEWAVQKRTGDKNKIAWNFSNGGKFSSFYNKEISNKAINISKKVLNCLHMDFGAIDFLVDYEDNIYFIEINSQPGINGLSNSIYINSINKLIEKKM